MFWALAGEHQIKVNVSEIPLVPTQYEKHTALKILTVGSVE